MPNVPYNPVPSVGQQLAPTPKVSTNAPLEAFGGATAAALGNIGKALDKAGDEIFNRAIAFQELDNQAKARDAQTQYLIESGQTYEEFKNLRGTQATSGYPAYQEKLAETRAKLRESLPNDRTRKLFDDETAGTFGRTIIYGAGHAATENRRAVQESYVTSTRAIGDSAAANPHDEIAFKKDVEKVRANEAGLEETRGLDSATIEQRQAEAESNLKVKRVHAIARTEPNKANELLKKYLADGTIRGEKQEAIQKFVRDQQRTIGARAVSQRIESGSDLHWGSQVVTPSQAKYAIGTMESGNSYTKVGPPTTSAGRGLGKYQVMERYLPDYLRVAGLPAMTRDEFLKSPDVQEKVFEAAFLGNMKKYGSFNEAASRWFTGMSVADARADFEKRGTTDGIPGRKGTNINEYLAKTNGLLARQIPLGEKVARGEELARELAPDDPLMPDFFRERIESAARSTQRVKANEQFQDRQTVVAGIVGRPGQPLPTTMDELFAQVPEAADAYSRLDPTLQVALRNSVQRNSKGDVRWSDDGNARYTRLYGLYKSRDAEFLDIDIAGEEKLPLDAKRQLLKWQEDMKANPAGDPRTQKALTLIRGSYMPQLEALRIATRTEGNKEEYSKYVGALSIALDDYQQQNGKPATDAIILKEIAPKVLATTKSSWPWPFNSETAKFQSLQVEVPKDFLERVNREAQTQGAEPPSSATIGRMWLRFQWQELNKPTPKWPGDDGTVKMRPK